MPGSPVGFLVKVAELLLQDSVDTACLLLLTELGQVLGALPHPVTAVLAGRVRPGVAVGYGFRDGALERIATLALQKELGSLAPAQAAYGSGVSSHLLSPVL